ncbi:YceI family protein [Croceitalea sp. MTPC9]|nr:YceI family protein [Croceitalea sp. MTPC6]GMN17977.1 YceI family protein [Croceitalea sp. MTPC9]
MHSSLIVSILLICSCNTRKKEEKTMAAQLALQERFYAIDTTGISLQWTAYKFTDKMAVHGTFNDFSVDFQKNKKTIEDLLVKDKITIHTMSVNSGAEIRDAKLKTYFFEVFKSDIIRGEILDAKNGKGVMNIELNTISREVDYTYSQKGDTLFLKTAINLANWKGEEAINTLNRECYELHMGVDKVSKLWPNVVITIKLPINISHILK